MNKFDKFILVAERALVLGKDYFQGFKIHNEVDYQNRILRSYIFMRRGDVEEDPDWKQPIGYAFVVNPKLKNVFAYKRSDKGGENRLHGKWSWGIGGHIEKFEEDAENPIYASLLRELEEEIEIKGKVNEIKVLGYINDDNDLVGKVHFGIVYVVETDTVEIKPRDSEIEFGKLTSIEELEKICSSPEQVVEEWSRIAFEPLKEYFRRL